MKRYVFAFVLAWSVLLSTNATASQFLWNHKLKQWVTLEGEIPDNEVHEYIPQTEFALGLYHSNIEVGIEPNDARIITLEEVVRLPSVEKK